MAMCPLDNNIIAFGVPAAEAHRGSLVASEVARASPSLDEASCAPSRISQVMTLTGAQHRSPRARDPSCDLVFANRSTGAPEARARARAHALRR